ncbi:MAG: DUF4012 domain-containing protein [Anaerolineae bacterium]|nr:DUF4012 domain-containing protein [Anaerolineae bacterium]
MSVNEASAKGDPAIGYRRRYVLLAILLLALVIIAVLWPIGKRALSLARHLQGLQAALDEDPLTLLAPEGRGMLIADLEGVESDLGALQHYLAPAFVLTPHLGWVPYAGDTLKALPDMLDMAQNLSTAGTTALDALSAFDSLMMASSSTESSHDDATQKLLEAIIAAGPQLRTAADEIEEAVAARKRFSDAELLFPLVSPFQRLDAYLPLLSAGMQALQLAPDLMGATNPRTYLLVAQNGDELRATGGFISGIGLVTVQDGEIAELSFQDSYAVENWAHPHPDPPEPLRKHMLADLWVTRDANWWPDFPTSARAIQEMYALNQGMSTDGVIAVDITALELIVGALEPLVLEDSGEKITGANLREKIYEFWAPSSSDEENWWRQRKDFMPILTAAVLARIQDPRSLDAGKLAYALKRGLDEKHILLYFNDPSVQQLLTETGWDGGVSTCTGDYLMVVDSNVGFNKVNAKIEQSIEYRISLQEQEGPLAELVLSYRHLSDVRLDECVRESRYDLDLGYQEMMDRCYWDYVRVYAPQGSSLLGVEGANEYEALAGEKGKAVFAADFVLAPGEERQITFRYRLPGTVLADDESLDTCYRLLVQKQPGTIAIPLQVRIELPPRTKVVDADPQPTDLGPGTVGYTASLQVDRSFQLTLGPAE